MGSHGPAFEAVPCSESLLVSMALPASPALKNTTPVRAY